MASMTQPTPASSLHLLSRQRLTLLLLVISLVAATIATVAVQRQAAVPVAPAQVAVSYEDYDDYFFQVTSGQMLQQPETARPVAVTPPSRLIDAYEQLQFQWLAAEQARRAGNTEAYEIAVAGVEALQSRIADLQAQPYALTDLDRALIEAYEQLHVQRLAAEQAFRARNTEAYEIATAGAEALESRITSLQMRYWGPS